MKVWTHAIITNRKNYIQNTYQVPILYHEENPQNEKCKASHTIIFYSICFYFIIRTNYMVGLWKRGTCT